MNFEGFFSNDEIESLSVSARQPLYVQWNIHPKIGKKNSAIFRSSIDPFNTIQEERKKRQPLLVWFENDIIPWLGRMVWYRRHFLSCLQQFACVCFFVYFFLSLSLRSLSLSFTSYLFLTFDFYLFTLRFSHLFFFKSAAHFNGIITYLPFECRFFLYCCCCYCCPRKKN